MARATTFAAGAGVVLALTAGIGAPLAGQSAPKAVKLLKTERPDLQIVIPAASTVADVVKARVAGWPNRAHVIEDEVLKTDAMKAATVALACS